VIQWHRCLRLDRVLYGFSRELREV